jgi:hypothetical protein
MQKLSKPILIIIFLFICGLLGCIVFFVRTFFGSDITLTENQYYILFSIIAFISFLAGIAFMKPQKSWTIENFIVRMNNIITINTTIINLYRKKMELVSRNPELKKIPDSVKVTITSTEIKEFKK